MRRMALLVMVLGLLTVTGSGTVMNANTGQLPPGCEQIVAHENITIHAGREFAEQFNGKVFTYDDRSLSFQPCTKVTVTFVNNDSIRHQFMVHGLPTSVYPGGMFTIEVTGPGRDTGTFILPSGDETLLVHCGLPQHMQKGMKAQITVGAGHGDLPNIPGITGSHDEYQYREAPAPLLPVGIAGAMGVVLGATTYLLFIMREDLLTDEDEE